MSKKKNDEACHYSLHLRNGAELHADWLVDATGRGAWLGKRCGVVRERLDAQMAAVCWMEAAPGDCDGVTRTRSVPEGWWYTALLPGGVRVASLQALPATVARMVKEPALFFEAFNNARMVAGDVQDSRMIAIRAVEAGVVKSTPVAREGLVCVGDAALAPDPLSSQGIFFALYSGIRGAEAIVQGMSRPDLKAQALQAYNGAVEKVFEAHQRTARWLYSGESRYAAAPYWQERLSLA